MDMELQQQRFENFQNFQNLEAIQQQVQAAAARQQNGQLGYNAEKVESVSNGGENHHFRMRYPSITPRNRVLKLSGNCNSLEQVSE